MDYIPDYNDLHSAYELERENKLEKFPKCECCSEPITDDYFYNIDGTYFHEECLKDNYRVSTDNYIKD